MKKFKPKHKHDLPGMTCMMIWRIPEKVKERFKRACFKKGVPMKDVIIKYMERFAKNA